MSEFQTLYELHLKRALDNRIFKGSLHSPMINYKGENARRHSFTFVNPAIFQLVLIMAANDNLNYDNEEDYINDLSSKNIRDVIKAAKDMTPNEFISFCIVAKQCFSPHNLLEVEKIFNNRTDLAVSNTKSKDELFSEMYKWWIPTVNSLYEKNLFSVLKNNNDVVKLPSETEHPYFTFPVSDINNHLKDLKCSLGLKEILCARFFGDTYNNVFHNLKSISGFYEEFSKSLNEKQIGKILPFVNLFKAFSSTFEYPDFLSVYNTMKIKEQGDAAADLYNALALAKKVTGRAYLDAITPLSTFPCQVIDGVKIYKSNGLPFRMLISTAANKSKCKKVDFFNRRYDMLSASFVSDNSLITYNNLHYSFAFGFTDFDPSHFYSINTKDNYVEFKREEIYGFYAAPEFVRPETVLENSRNTNFYNEINLIALSSAAVQKMCGKEMASEYFTKRSLIPSCIFCVEDPTPEELDYSKKHNIPIFIAESKNLSRGITPKIGSIDYDFTHVT